MQESLYKQLLLLYILAGTAQHPGAGLTKTRWINGSNVSFMEALEKSKKPGTVEIRGANFSLRFDLPAKAKTNLINDWKLYKKANGNHPVLRRMVSTLKLR